GPGSVATRLTIRNALDTLPARQREAVVLRYLADLSVEQTATAMGCAPGTVKSAAHTALETLRIELEEDDDAYG
ncbi:MAG: polymerase, sigma-24 subunit, subfamily, partial [Actinomycetia bacterium]|nr:polymerase, sigma-24 subunit, subfamily [Actinomycetes bacterium]